MGIKNAVNTLNTAARTSTGIESARSIELEDIYGIIDENEITKGADYGKVFKYSQEKHNGQTFVKNGETITIDEITKK